MGSMTIFAILMVALFIFFAFYLYKIGASTKNFLDATIEILVTYFISNLPMIFLIAGAWLDKSPNKIEVITNNLKNIINGGEVFIYISAVLAPVVWILVAYFKDSHRVLTGIYVITLFSIVPFAAFSFQQARLSSHVDPSALNTSAIILYSISLMLWYGAVVYTRFVGSYSGPTQRNNILKELN